MKRNPPPQLAVQATSLPVAYRQLAELATMDLGAIIYFPEGDFGHVDEGLRLAAQDNDLRYLELPLDFDAARVLTGPGMAGRAPTMLALTAGPRLRDEEQWAELVRGYPTLRDRGHFFVGLRNFVMHPEDRLEEACAAARDLGVSVLTVDDEFDVLRVDPKTGNIRYLSGKAPDQVRVEYRDTFHEDAEASTKYVSSLQEVLAMVAGSPETPLLHQAPYGVCRTCSVCLRFDVQQGCCTVCAGPLERTANPPKGYRMIGRRNPERLAKLKRKLMR